MIVRREVHHPVNTDSPPQSQHIAADGFLATALYAPVSIVPFQSGIDERDEKHKAPGKKDSFETHEFTPAYPVAPTTLFLTREGRN